MVLAILTWLWGFQKKLWQHSKNLQENVHCRRPWTIGWKFVGLDLKSPHVTSQWLISVAMVVAIAKGPLVHARSFGYARVSLVSQINDNRPRTENTYHGVVQRSRSWQPRRPGNNRWRSTKQTLYWTNTCLSLSGLDTHATTPVSTIQDVSWTKRSHGGHWCRVYIRSTVYSFVGETSQHFVDHWIAWPPCYPKREAKEKYLHIRLAIYMRLTRN